MKISAVSYFNTKPFIYGIENSGYLVDYELELDNPAEVANKLTSDQADIGLVPVAVLPFLENHKIITDHCISANGPVYSVALFSEVPLEEIDTILLDPESRTSIQLVKVLATKHWKINVSWLDGKDDYIDQINGNTAGVVIGDRAFNLRSKYPYVFDLAEVWKEFTGLPFVFACWVANNNITEAEESDFKKAVAFGADRIDQVLKAYQGPESNGISMDQYLNSYIDYQLDTDKRKAIDQFLELSLSLSPV